MFDFLPDVKREVIFHHPELGASFFSRAIDKNDFTENLRAFASDLCNKNLNPRIRFTVQELRKVIKEVGAYPYQYWIGQISNSNYDVCINVYDAGGFGDVAAALRIASHMQRNGIKVYLKPMYKADKKLRILNADVPINIPKVKAKLFVDASGYGGDSERGEMIPDLFIQVMDTGSDEIPAAPAFLRTGLKRVYSGLLGKEMESPMFYRPFREYELPKTSERQAKFLILNAISNKNLGLDKKTLKRSLINLDRIGFAHFNPTLTVSGFFNSGYVLALEEAARRGSSIGLGVFFSGYKGSVIMQYAGKKGYTIISNDGKIYYGKKQKPTLIFLGPQTQLMTASLFLSSTMPNLVTGDLSLSDAIYFLCFIGGGGFYYDAPKWKRQTFDEMLRIFGKFQNNLKCQFQIGSSYINPKIAGQYADEFSQVVKSLANPSEGSIFRASMRNAFMQEISLRFGNGFFVNELNDGLYVPSGAPFLVQDAAERVVRNIVGNPNLYLRIKKAREIMQSKKAKP